MRQIELLVNALGTICKLVVFVDDSLEQMACEKVNEIKSFLLDMDDKLSLFKKDSEINKINEHNGPVEVSEITFEILEESIKYYKETNGVFDILLGNYKNTLHVENSKIPAKLNQNIDENLILANGTATLKEGYKIDLGGIAKGYAINETRKILLSNGINKAILNYGGSVVILGEESDIGIRNPFLPLNKGSEEKPFCKVKVNGETVITSGIYEQSDDLELKEHHIINPKTGMPSETDILSVSVIDFDAIKADVYATTMIVLGFEQSVKMAEDKNLLVVLALRNGKVFVSTKLRERFEMTQNNL